VNEWTNSAAAIVAAFAAENYLAEVVGWKTRGKVVGAAISYCLPAIGSRLRVWLVHIKGRLIEGTGVQPSECADDAAAFASGEDSAMARAQLSYRWIPMNEESLFPAITAGLQSAS
jgi:C-terminal processing protease CtpA/Prc